MKHTLNLFSLAMVFAVIASAVGMTPAFATVEITVDTTADNTAIDGHCSLREAILNINSNSQLHSNPGECISGSSTSDIIFANVMSGKTITLLSDLPDISKDMYITDFLVSKTVTISGAGKYRVFDIFSGVTVSLSNLNIINGYAHGAFGSSGGGIYNAGTLTILDSTLAGNKAANGGAILNSGVGSGNTASLTIENSTFSGNSATTDGGAIYIAAGYGGTAVTFISNSTFTGNNATSSGGAIEEYVDTGSSLSLFSDTISGNSAGSFAGNLYVSKGSVNMVNTIIANPIHGGNCSLFGSPTIAFNGYNLVGGGSCLPVNTGYLSGNPKLGPLANNGGYTRTMLPASNSPVIDKGFNTFCAVTPINNLDQRGKTRPVNGTCDIGSVEYSPIQYVTNPSFENNTGQYSIPKNWSAVGFHLNPDGVDTTHFAEGAASVKINGAPSKTKSLSQLRLIGSPAAGWFTLSYWVRGHSVPATGTCRVQVALYKGTTLKMTKAIACPNGTYVFTKRTIAFWTTSPITKAIVTIIYSKSSGQVWFDAVRLKE